jgi:hypothetical protein
MDATRPSNTQKCMCALSLFSCFSAGLDNVSRGISGSDINPDNLSLATFGGNLVFRIAAVVLLLLWVLGLATGHTMGGFVHVLIVLALVLGLIGLVRGKNP